MRLRRFDRLTYCTQAPMVTRGGFAGATQAMLDLVEVLLFGTTTGGWERRCEASLAASRRRRGVSQ